ncbi:MAG: hypothetical protein WC876_01755 [Candidatus Thermoplasmatota archaeon]
MSDDAPDNLFSWLLAVRLLQSWALGCGVSWSAAERRTQNEELCREWWVIQRAMWRDEELSQAPATRDGGALPLFESISEVPEVAEVCRDHSFESEGRLLTPKEPRRPRGFAIRPIRYGPKPESIGYDFFFLGTCSEPKGGGR